MCPQDAVAPGTKLSTYEILAPLGAGGMGEVYAALDPALNRKVAIKVLSDAVAGDPERRERFEHEAKAIAALNHPNIVTVHAVESADGRVFITMELVKGRALQDLIPTAGMSVGQLLDVAVPLVDAVAAAHQQGLTHRDLKPANVMVTDAGLIKVLDFGLAKFTGDGPAGLRTTMSTQPGVIVGTVPYMSPEQAEGRPVDSRSDIFSMGIMLHEMATGRRPFEGKSGPGVLAAIIESTPTPLTDLRPDLPRELERIVKRCLAKLPDRRYQTARDLATDLDELRMVLRSAPNLARPIVGTPPKIAWWRSAVGGAVLAAFGGVAGYLAVPNSRGTDPAGMPSGHFRRVTSQAGTELYPRLSPDGAFVLYVSRDGGDWDIFLKRVAGEKPINLTEDSPSDDTRPAYSVDGRFIAFRSERGQGGLYVMGATGENPRRLSPEGFDPSWSPDGTELVYSLDPFIDPLDRRPSTLWIVNVASGTKRQVSAGDAVQGAWSPTGRRIAYWGFHQGGQRDLWTVAESGGEPVQLTRDAGVDWNPIWSPDGRHIYYASDRGGSMNLWRIGVEESTGQPTSDPEPIGTPSSHSQHLSLSRDGRQLAFVDLQSRVNLQQAAFDPSARQVVGRPLWVTGGARLVKNADLSPDGAWFAFDSITDDREDLFVVRSDGTAQRQLTDDAFKDRAPRWSPDGSRIAFLSDGSGRYECWTMLPDGSGATQISQTTGTRWAQAPVWSPDGRSIACNTQGSAPIVIDAESRDAGRPTHVAAPGGSPEREFFAWSTIGGLVGRSAEGQLMAFTPGQDRFRAIAPRGTRPIWLGDGRGVLYINAGVLWLADGSTGRAMEILSVAPNQVQSFGISRDNRTLYFTVTTSEADVWVASLR
jgi:Tol biopolymer transport system component